MIILSLALAFLASTVAPTAGEIRPLLIGQKVPDVTLADIDGKPVELRALVAE